MKPTNDNVYFNFGTQLEQNLIEDLIIESIRIYGNKMYYVPRTLVSKDNILGEDRLSQFNSSYPIEMYFENIDAFGGQGFMLQKFGLMVEQSATLVVARKRWNQLVGKFGQTILPDRPAEGDLIYFPLTKGLFEIKFVQHQDPFYQLGKLYVYKLQVELFQYASEKIDTGISEIDVFESLKTFSVDTADSAYGSIKSIIVTNSGHSYTVPPTVTIGGATGGGAYAEAVLGTGLDAGKVVAINIIESGMNYSTIPDVTITGDGVNATARAEIFVNIDKIESYGDNNQFKSEATTTLFDTSNPFGDV
jgi:hypothetical protein